MTSERPLSLGDGLNRLLRAMAAHDPKMAPLAAGVRYTENGQPLDIGDGLWGTLTRFAGDGGAAEEGLNRYRIDFVDEAGGQASYFGATLETITPGMMLLRMRMQNGEITEIEAIAVREEIVGEHGGTVTMFQPRLPLPFEPRGFVAPDPALVTPGSSPSADDKDLTDVVDAYFDAIENDNAGLLRIAPGCVVRNNGLLAADNPERPPINPEYPAYKPFALSLAEQIETGFSRYTSRISHRRHVAVDPSRGLVLSVAVFDHAARVKAIEVPGIGTVELPGHVQGKEETTIAALPGSKIFPNLQVPTSDLHAQLIRIEGGRIAYIETISRGAPYGLSTGW
jgi:hypothetical protein